MSGSLRSGADVASGTDIAGGVAVVGMAALFPGAPDLKTFWRNVTSGYDAITEVPSSRWAPWFFEEPGPDRRTPVDRVYCRRGGFVDEFAKVAVTRFGIPPTAVEGIEPDQLIALHVAAQAIDDAGGPTRLPDRDRIGVILGRGGYVTPAATRFSDRIRGANQLVQTLRELVPELPAQALDRIRFAYHEALGPFAPESAIGLVSNLAASRLANRLDLRGPAYTVDGACASSLLAVDQAVTMLRSRRCDVMLAGGVHHCHDVSFWSVFSQMRALSPTQRIRPFHRDADGTLIGEGTGVVVLKRAADALRDGDRVYAVIRGIGVTSDGRSASLMNPDPAGQIRAVRQAWREAGLDPTAADAIGLLEAHGTATKAGDEAEIRTMREVFGTDGPPVALGSVKSMIGHTMPAAGVAGLIKAALAVHHALLPPTLHCDDPHPGLAGTRFQLMAQSQEWPVPEQSMRSAQSGQSEQFVRSVQSGQSGPGLRRAAVNAFGFGGINAHVVLEQAPLPVGAVEPPPMVGGRRRAAREDRVEVLDSRVEDVIRLSARSPEALARLLAESDDATLRRLSLPADHVDGGAVRLAVAEPDARRLTMARRIVAAGAPWRGRTGIWFAPHGLLADPPGAGPGEGRLAFAFPGLDIGFVPRLDDVSAWLGSGRITATSEDAIRHGMGVLRVGLLVDRALRAAGVIPDAVLGTSLGEWSALISSGALGSQVQNLLDQVDPDSIATPDLTFLAVGRGTGEVTKYLAGQQDVVVSHDNAPDRCVVCGPAEGVHRLAEELRPRGVLTRELPFRSGFHTPMFAPYAAPFRSFIETVPVAEPELPVWSATTASCHLGPAADVRAIFLNHLVRPVRLRQTVEAMYAAGFRVFVQAGLGQVSSMIDETLGDREHLTVEAASASRNGMPQLRRVMAALWVEGLAVCLPVPEPSVSSPGLTGQAGAEVALDLSSTLMSFGPAERAAVRDILGSALAGNLAGPSATGEVRALPAAPLVPEAPQTSDVIAVEYRALVCELAQVAELALASRTSASTPAPAPAPALASRAPVPVPQPGPESGPALTPATRGPAREVLRIDTATMPYLRDHCFVRQRPDWPDESDRRPVVPATTIIQHMIVAAERHDPGRRVVELRDLRLHRWLVASPPVDVPVTLEPAEAPLPEGLPELRITLGEYSSAVLRTAPQYPVDRPHPWTTDAEERAPRQTAEQLYRERLTFHGPAFQGVSELTAIGDRHIRGVITVPQAPGALLDCAGQILGYWTISTVTSRTRVLPVRLGRLRMFGPKPAPGTRVDCHVRVTQVDRDIVEADIQLTQNGAVWAELRGWRNRRFDNHRYTQVVESYPEYRALSQEQPGGWVLLFERWDDLASRDLVMRNHLGSAERVDYQACSPRSRRHWLLGRIAVKDAVRTLLWQDGGSPVFPAEIRVGGGQAGRLRVDGLHGRVLPVRSVVTAQCAEVAVALVRSDDSGGSQPPAGIAVREVPPGTPDPGELRAAVALAAVAAATDGTTTDGTTTDGAECVVPGGDSFRVVSDDGEVVHVAGPDGRSGDRVFRVQLAAVSNPQDLVAREYLVAWTV